MKMKTIITVLLVSQCLAITAMDPEKVQNANRLKLERMHLLDTIINGDPIDFEGKDIANLNVSLYVACQLNKAHLIPSIIEAGAQITSQWAQLALIHATVKNDTNSLALLYDAGIKAQSLGDSLCFAADHLAADLIEDLFLIKDSIDPTYQTRALKILLGKTQTQRVLECLRVFAENNIVLPNPRIKKLKKSKS